MSETEIRDDLDVRDFADLLTEFPAHLPISDEFEAKDTQKRRRWWTSQREHLIFHFLDQLNPDPLGRPLRKKSNFSAKATYGKIKHAEGIVWLAEALNVLEPDQLKDLADAALKVERSKRVAYVRTSIPWSVIFKKAQAIQVGKQTYAEKATSTESLKEIASPSA